jgi:hypothetical protein
MSRTPILNPFDEDERSGRRPVVWAIFGLGVLCICGLVTGMVYIYKPDPQIIIAKYFATATPTITSTPTQTATPTPDVLLTAISKADPIFEDMFTSNESHWSAHFSNNTVSISNGLLNLRSGGENYIGIAYCKTCPLTGKTFFYQANVSLRENLPKKFGVAFCIGGIDEYYTFSISQKYERFDFFKHSSLGWQTLARNQYSTAIREYPSPNTLGVFYDKSTIKLYINNILEYSYMDEEPFINCSRLGFFVDDGGFDLLGDNVKVHELPPMQVPKP